MRNYRSLSLDEVAKKIKDAKNPVIAIHRSPDGDAVGSAMGLSLILRALGKKAEYICADKIPERLSFVSDGLDYASGDLDGRDIICVDIASPSQLGKLAETEPKSKTPYLMIDHHAIGEVFADSYIIPEACATGEIIYDIAERMASLGYIDEITPEMASALYAAISSDSGCFRFSNAKSHTHIVAARLIEKGIDTAEINRLLFDSKTEAQLKAEGLTLNKMQSLFGGRLALACITKNDRDTLGLKFEDFETAIDIVRSLRGVEISAVIKEQDDGTYKASLRSVGADVASVCAKFGGGGHIRAAGCSVAAKSEDEAINKIITALKDALTH